MRSASVPQQHLGHLLARCWEARRRLDEQAALAALPVSSAPLEAEQRQKVVDRGAVRAEPELSDELVDQCGDRELAFRLILELERGLELENGIVHGYDPKPFVLS